MSSPAPLPKDLRPDLIRRIETMADDELQFVHAVLLQAEKDRLGAEISAGAEEDRLSGVFERLPEVIDEFREPLKKKVGGSLARLPPLGRLAMLRRNALMLRGGRWTPPTNDGTVIRKVVGAAR